MLKKSNFGKFLELGTWNTRGSVVVTPPSFFLSGCLLRYAKKAWKTVRFPPSADPTKAGTFVLCISGHFPIFFKNQKGTCVPDVSGHFSVFEVLNFFVQQIIKNAPNQISGSLNESILKKNLKRLKKAFKIVLGNFEFLEIVEIARYANGRTNGTPLQSCRGFHPLTRSNKKPFRLKEKILFKS